MKDYGFLYSVLRKLDVWLQTEHTVLVSGWERVQPREGIKPAVLSCSVPEVKMRPGFRLKRRSQIFLYSHQFLVVQEAQEVPAWKERMKRRVIHPDRCVFISLRKKTGQIKVYLVWLQDYRDSWMSLFILTGIKIRWLLGKPSLPSLKTRIPPSQKPHPHPHISVHSYLPATTTCKSSKKFIATAFCFCAQLRGKNHLFCF